MTLTATFSNVLTDQSYKAVLINVCDTIIEYLSNYCGPNATFASIPHDAMQEFQTDYTKDGISIIKTIKFNEPAAESIRQALSYIGDQINRASQDGTTTAILLYCLIIRNILNNDTNNLRLKNPKEFIKQMKYFLDKYKKFVPVHTVDTLKDITVIESEDTRFYVAYNLAMISSKGNDLMSKAIANYAAKAPIEEVFGVFDITHEKFESLDGSDYITTTDDYDICIGSYCESNTSIDGLNDIFKSDSCMIIASEDVINFSLPGYKDLYDELKEYADGTHLPEKDIVIYGLQIDVDISRLVNAYNQNQKYSPNPSPYRIICLRPLEAQNPIIPFYIKAMAVLTDSDNIEPFDMCKSLFTIKDAAIDYTDRRAKIKNLYKKNGSIYVPKYTSREDAAYNEFADMLKLRISNLFNGYSENKVSNDTMAKLLELYRYLVCSNRIKISFSGAKHDVLAFRSQMEDALGSVSSGIEKGFVISNFETMYKYFKVLKATASYTDIGTLIIDSVITSLEELLLLTNKNVYNFEEYKHYLKHAADVLIDSHASVDTLTGYYFKVHSVIDEDNHHVVNQFGSIVDDGMPLFQPAEAVKALIGRLSELLPYMLTTSSHIGNWADNK